MSEFLVGSRLLATITITDVATAVAVDPATIAFRLVAPSGSGIVLGTYSWDGATWTNSESTIAVPTKGATGIFTVRITIPYVNTAIGKWILGWKSTANGSGYGEGSGEAQFFASASGVL